MTIEDDSKHALAQAVITDERFNNLLEEEKEIILKMLIKKPAKGWHPQLVVVQKGKDKEDERLLIVIGVDIDFSYHKTKARIFFQIGQRVAKEGFRPEAIFFSSEAWVKATSKEEYQKVASGDKNVRDYPDKEEVIIIAGTTVDNRNNLASIEVKRSTKEGNIFPGRVMVQKYNPKDNERGNVAISNLARYFYQGFASVFFAKDKLNKKDNDKTVN